MRAVTCPANSLCATCSNLCCTTARRCRTSGSFFPCQSPAPRGTQTRGRGAHSPGAWQRQQQPSAPGSHTAKRARSWSPRSTARGGGCGHCPVPTQTLRSAAHQLLPSLAGRLGSASSKGRGMGGEKDGSGVDRRRGKSLKNSWTGRGKGQLAANKYNYCPPKVLHELHHHLHH